MKRISLIAFLLCLLLVFVSCAPAATTAQSESAAPAKSAEKPSAAEEPSAAGKPFEGQTLTVLYMSSVYADAARALAPEFEAATGAKVEVVDYPYLTLHEKALLDLTSQTGSYDVIDVACQWDGEFAPYLEPLTDYIARDNYDTSVFIPNVFAQAGTWQGVVMGIPNANTPQVVAYRTDLIPEGLPDTWEEYVALAEKLTDKDKGFYGISTPGVREQYGGIWDSILWSKGGAWADENWKIIINSKEARDALEISKRIYATADPAVASWGLEESIKAFLDGNAAICEAWPTLGITQKGDDPAQSKIVGKWALGLFPYEKNGITNLSAWDLSINGQSKVKDLAWEWIKMYTSAENQQKFYEEFNIFSPRMDFWEQPMIQDKGLSPLRTALDTALIWWRIPASVEGDTVVGTNVSSYVSGQITAEEALKNMEDGLAAALKNNPPADGVKNYNR